MDIGQVLVAIADSSEQDRVTAAARAAKKPKLPAKFSPTQRKVASMLRENTGASILDSGGAYGRSWQRNLVRAFWSGPATTLEGRIGYDGHAELEVTHNVFHWLCDRLEYRPDLTRRMTALGRREDLSGFALAERFPAYLAGKGAEVGGFYGEGDPVVVNTYNGEDLLSQTLQYVYFEFDSQGYVALQIHGGADVRGGYTEPVIFEVTSELAITDNARAGIAPDYEELKQFEALQALQPSLPGIPDSSVDVSQINWSTDDGCHWYYQGTCGRDYDAKQLDKMPAKEIADRSEWAKGVVCILPDHSVLCPFTGCKLQAGFY